MSKPQVKQITNKHDSSKSSTNNDTSFESPSNSANSIIALSILLLLVVIFFPSFYALKRRNSIKGFVSLNESCINDVRMTETNYIEDQ